MGDVRPLPLADDDEDFFSDLGSDEPYIRQQDVGSGSRLVIDLENRDNTPRSPRTNPFSSTEPRARNMLNLNQNHQHHYHAIDGNNSAVQNGRTDSNDAINDSARQHNGVHSIPTDHCHIPHKHEEDNTVRNQLIAISIFTVAFGIGETVGAVYSSSIAIGTDVMHLASDFSSFVISLVAVYLAKKQATSRLPWGFYRAEVLGALLSVFIIWVVTGVLVYLAIERVIYKTYADLEPNDMLYTAAAGVLFNIIMAVVLNVEIFKCKVSHGHSHDGGGHGHSHGGGQGHSHNVPLSSRNKRRDDQHQLTLNTDDDEITDRHSASPSSSSSREKNIVIRAAFVHVLGDLIQSVGVLVAALVIKFKGPDDPRYYLADPICTFVFSVLVLITTITVLRDAFFILMEGSPKKVPYDYLHMRLSELEGVKSVHSLKIWSLTSNEVNASVHLAVDGSLAYPYQLIKQANDILREGEIITRTTVQIEPYDEYSAKSCKQCLHPAPSTYTTPNTNNII